MRPAAASASPIIFYWTYLSSLWFSEQDSFFVKFCPRTLYTTNVFKFRAPLLLSWLGFARWSLIFFGPCFLSPVWQLQFWSRYYILGGKNTFPWSTNIQNINVHGSVHRKNILIYIQQDAMLYSLFYLEIVLHVLGGTTTHHQKRKKLYLQHLISVTPLLLLTDSSMWQIWYAVDTVVCASDDGWWYHPKHVQQFTDKINFVTLHLVGYTGCFRRNRKYLRGGSMDYSE
jgi:hypothetical protein